MPSLARSIEGVYHASARGRVATDRTVKSWLPRVARMTQPVDEGVQFPAVDGKISSQRTGKAIFAAAARYSDAELAERIEATSDWHKNYLAPVRSLTEVGARSAKDALRIADDGLDAAHRSFVFERAGSTSRLEDAFGSTEAPFEIATIEGRGERWTEPMVPYRGRELRGPHLELQLDRWVDEGRIEPSAAAAVKAVVEHPEWLDLSERTIALLGAASEMGPLEWLSRWGAHVVAVDLPGEHIWRRITDLVEAGAGRASVPLRNDTDGELGNRAGIDLIRQAPEARAWLRTFGPLTLGNYTYADGASFVRVAVAADEVATRLADDGVLASYAYLSSPTEVYAVPRRVVERARANRGRIGAGVKAITVGKLFAPSYREVSGDRGIYDCLVPQQGPNYALAKTLQRWRALTLRERGVPVSATLAPATRTKSVTKNKVLASAYAGAGPFGVEVLEPETSRALTALQLVRDLNDPSSAAQPEVGLDHPYDLFAEGALHGGLWTMPYEPRSVLPLAVILGLPRRKS